MAFSLFLAPASWYTFKIDDMGENISQAGCTILSLRDIQILVPLVIFFMAVLPPFVRLLLTLPHEGTGGKGQEMRKAAFCFMALWQFPFLLALYPAPGMNDTLFMIENPLYGGVQFPWLYSAIYGYGVQAGKVLWGSREPAVFLLALFQLAVYAWGLVGIVFFIKKRYGSRPALLLYLYFTFFPMMGNYGIAAVRDGLFSLSLVLWMILFLKKEKWEKKDYALAALASMGLMLLRSNGAFIAGGLFILLALRKRQWKREMALFVLCLIAAVLPGHIILSCHGWEPQFQESMAIPLQQLGRVMVMGGGRSDETVHFMETLLPEEKWKKSYSSVTVDFVKWHDDFRRDKLNGNKEKFLKLWLDTGLRNPRIYMEGWMTETYALWNLDPEEHSVQSRFGWALTDENTRNMKPSDNDMLGLGDFPMPFSIKSFLGNYIFSGSRFLGSGLCLWVTLFFCLLFYCGKRKELIFSAMPLLLNTATLLLSTPASAVFRYSFAYVPGLPLLLLIFLYEQPWGEGSET